ncbi:MAG: hypothetical protein NWF08_02325 [Candidatus Bathyarchaeota archaeon]|nr:hypothetical protein [Candidatus Bathyarchaeota archaeon]
MSAYISPYYASYYPANYPYAYYSPTYAMPVVESVPMKICRYCGLPATWISLYDRWYCYYCNKYV